MSIRHLACTWTAALALASCGGTLSVGGEADAGPDSAPDTSVGDVPADVVPEVTPDSGSETVEDVAVDTVVDTAADTAPDPGEDTAVETAVDVPSDWVSTGMTGDPCTDAGDCGAVPSDTRFCMDVMWGFIPFPGGYCTAWCGSDSECGTGAGCAVGQCFLECTVDSECRTSEGYVCRTIPYVTTQTYCLPPPW